MIPVGAGETKEFGEESAEWNRFPVLAQRSYQIAGTLSGGEQQMLAIGRGLMANPKLLLLDEPSLGLAPVAVTRMFDLLTDIRSQGVTLVLVEQNAFQALRVADRAYVLEGGPDHAKWRPADLLHDPTIKSAYLGGNVAKAK